MIEHYHEKMNKTFSSHLGNVSITLIQHTFYQLKIPQNVHDYTRLCYFLWQTSENNNVAQIKSNGRLLYTVVSFISHIT